MRLPNWVKDECVDYRKRDKYLLHPALFLLLSSWVEVRPNWSSYQPWSCCWNSKFPIVQMNGSSGIGSRYKVVYTETLKCCL